MEWITLTTNQQNEKLNSKQKIIIIIIIIKKVKTAAVESFLCYYNFLSMLLLLLPNKSIHNFHHTLPTHFPCVVCLAPAMGKSTVGNEGKIIMQMFSIF